MSGACAVCGTLLPEDWAVNIHSSGARSCLGSCRPLFLFESGNPDWVVAHDEADALQVWCDQVGEEPDGYDATDWRRVPDDETSKYWITPDGVISAPDEGDGAELVELTALETVLRFGRGFVASVDF